MYYLTSQKCNATSTIQHNYPDLMEYTHSHAAHNYVSWSTCVVCKATHSQIFEPLTKIKAYHLNTIMFLNLSGIT